MAFKSKYTGSQIENLLDSVNNGELTLTENDIAGMGFTKNTGTITAIQANGTTVASSGTANIPAATTSAYGVTKLSTSTSSTSTSLAATASAVKSAYDLANGKQDKLVSGTNIKTINGQSLLGSGDITIEGGGSSEGGSSAYVEVNHGTSDTTFTLTPNTFHIWGEMTAMTLTLGAEASGIANEYIFQFISPTTPTTLTLPDDIKFSEDLTIEANKIYQISILKGLGSVLSWDNGSLIKDNFIDIQSNTLVFLYPTASELSIDVHGRTTGMPSNYTIVVPSGSSSYTTSLTTILYINSVSPSTDEKYNYTYQKS